jgi:chitinase
MVWSIDQDNTSFSALKALTGRDLRTFADALGVAQVASGSWASQNGQNCKMTECVAGSRVGSWGLVPPRTSAVATIAGTSSAR